MKKPEIYCQLSQAYNRLYLKNLLTYQKEVYKNPKYNEEHFVDFYPSFGTKTCREAEFIIYGQATNGWISDFGKDTAINDEKLYKSISSSNTFLKDPDHNPLDWVNAAWTGSSLLEAEKIPVTRSFYKNLIDAKYRAHKSFFWNVVYKLINDFYGMERSSWEWSRKIVWSNLYKIARRKENPNGYEQGLQMETSIELVKQEIKEIKPKYCIVLTNGKWWKPFGKALIPNFRPATSLPSKIDYYGKLEDTVIVVSKRPRFGDSDLYVEQILKLIKSNGRG